MGLSGVYLVFLKSHARQLFYLEIRIHTHTHTLLTCLIPGSMLNALQILSHLILTPQILQSRHLVFHIHSASQQG